MGKYVTLFCFFVCLFVVVFLKRARRPHESSSLLPEPSRRQNYYRSAGVADCAAALLFLLMLGCPFGDGGSSSAV